MLLLTAGGSIPSTPGRDADTPRGWLTHAEALTGRSAGARALPWPRVVRWRSLVLSGRLVSMQLARTQGTSCASASCVRMSMRYLRSLLPALQLPTCSNHFLIEPLKRYLNEPGALLRALAEGFELAGGELRTGSAAIGIRGADGGGATVTLEDGSMLAADDVVIAVRKLVSITRCLAEDLSCLLLPNASPCILLVGRSIALACLLLTHNGWHARNPLSPQAGAHSAGLVTTSLGEYCPLDTERGYHVAFEPGSEQLVTMCTGSNPADMPHAPCARRSSLATRPLLPAATFLAVAALICSLFEPSYVESSRGQ